VSSVIATRGNADERTNAPASTTAPRAASGQLTFEEVYAARFNDVLRWIRALGGLDADLDDLAQEVFLIVERKLPGFDGGNLGAWLYKIARNQVKDHKRRAWVRLLFTGRPQSSDARAVPLHIQPVPTPHEALEHVEILAFVSQILNRLPVQQRSAFVLFEIEGYSGEEIAELEDVPVNTVWTRLHIARKTFVQHVQRARTKGNLP